MRAQVIKSSQQATAACNMTYHVAGSQQIENKVLLAEYWRRQRVYLRKHRWWLQIIDMPADAALVTWSKLRPTDMLSNMCLLILDRPQLVLALRFLQGCGEQHAFDQSSGTKQCALFGKVQDLWQHMTKYGSAASLCKAHGLQLTAAYSTSKPKSRRYNA